MHRLSWLLILLLSTLTNKSLCLEEELCDDEPDDPDVCPFETEGDVTNVALGKTAEQSTTYHAGGEANLALDGNTDQHFWVGGSCAHTIAADKDPVDPKPWFRVDLGSPHLVQNVKLYSRKDPCCAHRSHDLEVRVGNDQEGGSDVRFHRNGICNAFKGEGYEKGKVFDFVCPPCLAGRYVSVQITRFCQSCEEPDRNVLTICELEVFGRKV